MKFKEFLARRSTHSMNPECMSDESDMNRRRSFGRGGAGNIRSREEAVTLPPTSMSMSMSMFMSIRSSMIHHHIDHEPGSGGGDESASASNSDNTETSGGSNPENDDAVHRPTRPYQFHYRYHYRHYRPGHFSGGSSGGSSSSSSSAWSSMSVSLSTLGTRESVVLSGGRGRFLSGMRQVLSGGSGGGGYGNGNGNENGQSPVTIIKKRRKGSL